MLSELVVHADAEKAVGYWLRTRLAAVGSPPAFLAGVTVVTKDPLRTELKTAKSVRLRRSGGVPFTPAHDAPRLDFQVRHVTDSDRMDLAQYVRGTLYAARGAVVNVPSLGLDTVIGNVVEFVGPGRFPDPVDPTQELILFTMEIGLRGVGHSTS